MRGGAAHDELAARAAAALPLDAEAAREHAPRERGRVRRHLGHAALRDDAAARAARAGAEVDQVIRGGDDLGRVLDHHHRVALVADRVQHVQQALDVARVEPHRRLVEHVQGAGERAAERGRELDALRLAAGERPHLPFERQVAETDLARGAHAGAQAREQARAARLLTRGSSRSAASQASSSPTLSRASSPIWRSPTHTASASGRSRVPPQLSQRSKRR